MSTISNIAVTGIAWTTPLGDSLTSVWGRLLAGETAMRPVPHRGRLRNDLAAAVPSPDAELPPAERLVKMASRTAARALAAAAQDPSDPGIRFVMGTSLAAYLDDGPSRTSLGAWATAAAREVGSARPPIVVSTACSAGSDAILVGAELIRSGAARCCVCGGADVLTWSKRLAHSTLGTLSPTRLRAFDVRHDGTLLGEGAAFIVLEASPTAREPIVFLRGTGSANDAAGMTAADASGLGARYALERSLADAQLEAADIGLISAHGSGTLMNDTTERIAFRDVFGDHGRPIVFATKGNFGHSLGATGAMEAITVILALGSRQVPPIVELEQPDPEFPLPLAKGNATACDAHVGLSLTLGFGGFDTSLVFEAPR